MRHTLRRTTYTYRSCWQNCAFFARHGVHDEEEVLGQRFFVDAELEVEAGQPRLRRPASIRPSTTASPSSVIEEIVTGRRRFLIEALALDMAKRVSVTASRRSQRAKITVRKPNAPIAGVLDYRAGDR